MARELNRREWMHVTKGIVRACLLAAGMVIAQGAQAASVGLSNVREPGTLALLGLGLLGIWLVGRRS